MDVRDITIEVRSLALGRLGQIDLRLVSDMKIIKRFNNVGAWSLTLPAEDDMATQLAQPGRGLTVEGPSFTLMSGRVLNWQFTQNGEDVLGSIAFQGVDDNVHLSDGEAWPQPSNPDTETQNVGHDIRTGVAETVMKAYVNANIGPGAPAARRIPEIVIAPDLSRGNVVTGRARFDKLGALLQQLGSPGVGNLGFDLVQVDNQLVFNVYEPEDKSMLVRMDVINDTLDSVTYGVSAPTVTRAIVAGQGEMENRRIIQVTDAEAAEAEAAWGRKIENFYDRRDTEDDAELIQTGVEEITAGGRTVMTLAVQPSDDQTMIYGIDWYLGDIVSVIVDDQPLPAIVSEAIISITAAGVTVGATVGDPTGFDFESQMINTQKDQEARIAFLEKNVEKGSTVNASDIAGIIELDNLPQLPWTQMDPDVIPEASIPDRLKANLPTLGTADLDTILDSGFYVQHRNVDATAARHYPAERAGLLEVVGSAHLTFFMQRYTDYQYSNDMGRYTWERTYYNGTWYPWRRLGSGIASGPASQKPPNPTYWEMYFETDTGYMMVGSKSGTWRRYSGAISDGAKAWDTTQGATGAAMVAGRSVSFVIPTVLETRETLQVTMDPALVTSGFNFIGVTTLTRNPTNTVITVRLMQLASFTTQPIQILWTVVPF